MGKTVKRYQASMYDDERDEKRIKSRHLKHAINKEQEDFFDDEDDFKYREEVEYLLQKRK